MGGIMKELLAYEKRNFEELLAKYNVAKSISDLEARLKANDNQLVLLKIAGKTYKHIGGFIGGISGEFETREAGLIVPPYVEFNNNHAADYGIKLTTNQVITLRRYDFEGDFHNNIILDDENHGIEITKKLITGETIRDPLIYHEFERDKNWHKQIEEVALKIGNDEVEEFLLKNYKRGIEIYEFIKSPEKIQEMKDSIIKKAKETIIGRLESLLKKEEEIRKRIDSIYGSIKGGGFVEGGAIVPIENEDDARIVSWGERDKLQGMQSEIRSTLDDALKLKMHMDLTKYVVESVPGKKTEILISEYIMNLNAKYKKEVNV